MKTVNHQRAAGYTIQPATDAVDCTEVLRDDLFLYYNGRHHTTMQSIMANLTEAAQVDGSYRMVTAGRFDGDDEFPWVLVNRDQGHVLHRAFAAFNAARQASEDATTRFDVALIDVLFA